MIDYLKERYKKIEEFHAYLDELNPVTAWTWMTDDHKAEIIKELAFAVSVSDDQNIAVSNAVGDIMTDQERVTVSYLLENVARVLSGE